MKQDNNEYFIFVQDRESLQWKCHGTTTRMVRYGTSKRPKYETEKPAWIFPKPEAISCFVKAHKIIKAKTEVEAWQILNSK